jgi:hypothetical protein
MSLLLDCISMARHANAIIYSCQTLMNLVEFHESSQELLREARYSRILRDVLLTAGKGCVITCPALCLFKLLVSYEEHDIKKHVRLLMHKAKIKEHPGCSLL